MLSADLVLRVQARHPVGGIYVSSRSRRSLSALALGLGLAVSLFLSLPLS